MKEKTTEPGDWLQCTRCGYQWRQRGEQPPISCPWPECRSQYWNKKRKLKIKKPKQPLFEY